jgi:DNA-binding protein Fis
VNSHLQKNNFIRAHSTTTMANKANCIEQQRVIDKIPDDEWENMKHWEPAELYNMLSRQQKKPFLDSVVDRGLGSRCCRGPHAEGAPHQKNQASCGGMSVCIRR